MIDTICADKSDVPTFLIYKGSDVLQDCVDLVYDIEIALHCFENDLTNNSISIKWLKHFIKYAKPVENNGYQLLILDDHCSYITIFFKNFAVENHIILLCLPLHTIHKLQLLDVSQFRPFAKYYSQFVEDHVWYAFDIFKRKYISWILQARKKTNSESNILSAFRRTELILFNSDLILQSLKHLQK